MDEEFDKSNVSKIVGKLEKENSKITDNILDGTKGKVINIGRDEEFLMQDGDQLRGDNPACEEVTNPEKSEELIVHVSDYIKLFEKENNENTNTCTYEGRKEETKITKIRQVFDAEQVQVKKIVGVKEENVDGSRELYQAGVHVPVIVSEIERELNCKTKPVIKSSAKIKKKPNKKKKNAHVSSQQVNLEVTEFKDDYTSDLSRLLESENVSFNKPVNEGNVGTENMFSTNNEFGNPEESYITELRENTELSVQIIRSEHANLNLKNEIHQNEESGIVAGSDVNVLENTEENGAQNCSTKKKGNKKNKNKGKKNVKQCISQDISAINYTIPDGDSTSGTETVESGMQNDQREQIVKNFMTPEQDEDAHEISQEETAVGNEDNRRGTYKKSFSFIDIGGPFYEIKFALMLFVRGIFKLYGIEKFNLVTNLFGAEPFDDTVFQYFFKADDGSLNSRTCYIQLKHKKNKDSHAVSFDLKNKFFQKDLPKCCKYIYTLKHKHKSTDTSTPFHSKPEDCEYILYTNGGVDEKLEGRFCSCPHILSRPAGTRKLGVSNSCICMKNCSYSEIKENGHGIFTFKEDSDAISTLINNSETPDQMKEFIKIFQMFIHQASEEELDEIIQLDMQTALRKTNEEIKVIYEKLFEEIKTWWKEQDESIILTENSKILENILISEFVSHLMSCSADEIRKSRNVFSDDRVNECKKLIDDHVALITVTSGRVTGLSRLKVIQCLEEYRTNNYIFVSLSCLVEQKDEILNAWQSTDRLLVIDSDTASSEQKIDLCNNLWKYICSERNKKLIIILHQEDEFRMVLKQTFSNAISEFVDSFSFSDLHLDCQQQILNKYVKFQGYDIQFNDLIYKNMVDIFNADITFRILNNEDVHIGKNLKASEHAYLPRQLSCQMKLKSDLLEMAKHSARFAFSGITKERLKFLFNQPGEKIIECNILDNTSTTENDCQFFLLSNDSAEEDFRKLSMKYVDDVHWFDVNGNSLFWKKSVRKHTEKQLMGETNCMKLLHKYLEDDNETCNETDLTASIIPVVSEPGMGKSTLLKHMAVLLKDKCPSTWVIHIALGDHTKFLFEMKTFSLLDFIISAESVSRRIDDLEVQLLSHALNSSGNIIILLDGFDEVYSTYKEKIFQLLNSVQILKFRQLWVTSRQTMQNELEEILCSLSYFLLPLNEKEQEHLLMKWLKENYDVTQKECNSITSKALPLAKNYLSNRSHFMGNPQNVQMLAELLYKGYVEDQENFSQINLYKKFVQLKYDSYSKDKAGMDLTKPAVQQFVDAFQREFTENHEKLALFIVLASEDCHKLEISEETVNRIFQTVEMAGIVLGMKDGKPRFINERLAMYFAAQWLSKNYTQQRHFLMENFFRTKYNDLRQIFDLILANNLDCHLNIVNKRMSQHHLTSMAMVTDTGKRLPLHLAASYNNVNSAEQLLTAGHKRKQLSSVDEVLNWTPLQYAKETNSVDVLDKLIKVGGKFGHTGKNSDENLFVDAIKGNCINLTLHLMTEKKGIQICDESGNTPLHLAVWYSEYPMVREMVKIYCKEKHSILSFGSTKIPLEIDKQNKDKNTPLHLAAVRRKTDIMELLLKKGSNPELKNQCGNTVLHLAVWTGNNSIVKKLAKNKNIINICNGDGDTPLHLGVKVKHSEIVEQLVNNGANITIKNSDGHTPFHLSIVSDTTKVMNILLEAGSEVNEVTGTDDSCLHLAVEYGNLETVRKLVNRGANTNIGNATDNTSLHVAASQGNLEIVKFLVESGSDVKHRNKRGNTPLQEAVEQEKEEVAHYLYSVAKEETLLHEAVSDGKIKMVEFLVKAGADVNFCNNMGNTPLHLAIEYSRDNIATYLVKKEADLTMQDMNGNPPLHASILHGDIDMIKCILTNNSIVNFSNSKGDTPLHMAVHRNRTDIAKYLIKNGADTTKQNFNGNSPLHEAVKNGHIKMIDTLIKHGANPNHCNENGFTPLHIAVQEGREEVAICLMKHGADAHKPNPTGNPPLHEALESGNFKMAKLLVVNGIDINQVNESGNTPLNILAKMGGDGDIEVANFFMENGADHNIPNKRGNTPMIRAVTRGNIEFISFLVEKGIDINHGYPDDFSPLHAAVYSGDMTIVKYLIEELNADINVCDNKNNTPLHVAVGVHQAFDIIIYLVEKGADTNISNSESMTPLSLAKLNNFKDVEIYLMETSKRKSSNWNLKN